MNKQFIRTILASFISVLFCANAFGQNLKTYNGPFRMVDKTSRDFFWDGKATYSYFEDDDERIFNGVFHFVKEVKDTDWSPNYSVDLRCNIKNNLLDGEFKFTQKYLKKIKNNGKVTWQVTGTEEYVAHYKEGKLHGTVLYNNGNELTMEFEEGVRRSFKLKRLGYLYEGQFTKEGLYDGKWKATPFKEGPGFLKKYVEVFENGKPISGKEYDISTGDVDSYSVSGNNPTYILQCTILSLPEIRGIKRWLKPEEPVKQETEDQTETTEEDPEEDMIYVGNGFQKPEFVGDVNSWIAKHIAYPSKSKENGIQGLVMMQFVVEKDGSLSDIQVVKGINDELNKEAIRVVSTMPKWNPGKSDGKIVRCQHSLPVFFRLR